MAGRVLSYVYVAGYFFYVAAAAVSAWPRMSLSDWWTYMAFQAGIYGLFWPVILVLNLLGVHW